MRYRGWEAVCVSLLGALLGAVLGCNGQQPSTVEEADGVRHVSVAAAADLRYAFDELIAEFHEATPDVSVQVTYGSSGNFFAQLSNRAPFDIYFSADIEYPRRLVRQGFADGQTELLYGVGQIVIWVSKDSSLDVEQLGIRTLLEPGVRTIAIANPQHAPYGRAAESALKSLGVYNQVRDRLILGENIAQAAQFVESGAADIGVLALSLVLAPAMKAKGRYWQVPTQAYPTLEQGGVILNWAKDREATEAFRSFVAGARGREVLNRYGFLLPGK